MTLEEKKRIICADSAEGHNTTFEDKMGRRWSVWEEEGRFRRHAWTGSPELSASEEWLEQHRLIPLEEVCRTFVPEVWDGTDPDLNWMN